MDSADILYPEPTTPSAAQLEGGLNAQTSARSAEQQVENVIMLQATEEPCTTCGETRMSNGEQNRTAEPVYVYALGQIEHRFPNLGLEKEFVQATGRADMTGFRDRQAAHSVLVERQNRYLARQLCWVLQVEGLDAYIIQPRDPMDFEMLIEALDRPSSNDYDVDVVIGMRGPLAPSGMCNGLTLPVVFFEQVYSFDRDSLVKAMPKPKDRAAEQFEDDAKELFSRIVQLADNAGATDEHRALNYLAVRYPEIYHETSRRFNDNASLTAVDVRPSRLSGSRKILDVIFSYTHRQTDMTEKRFVRVDVTEMFPFLVTKLSNYYER